jgi:hypothetical protein
MMMARVRVEELIGDVSENGGASRRDAASGNQSEEAGEELAEIDSGGELGEFGEEVGRKVFRVVVQLQGSGGFGQRPKCGCEPVRRQRLPLAKRYRQRVESLKGMVADSGRTVALGSFVDGFMMFLPGRPRAICMNIKRKDLRNLHSVNA